MMTPYAPLLMVGGFLAFGLIFVLGDEISQWIARCWEGGDDE